MEFWKDLESIKELIKAVSEAKVDFEWKKDDGCKILISGAEKKVSIPQVKNVEAPVLTGVSYETQTAYVSETVKEQSDNTDENVQIVTSPLVGTFYSAASPEDEPFVKVGDRVAKGQKLGIIEAMKLMNDIESDYDGEIVEIMVLNENMVEYGQPLFKIK